MPRGKKVVAIVQARLGSSRFPGKTLSPICGKPLLYHVLNRLGKAKMVDKIVLATTIDKKDDRIVSLCRELNVTVFRGSEEDVLDRYYKAAKKEKADIVVRVTADCPLVDPEIVDRSVQLFFKPPKADYVGYDLSFPDGSDVETFSFQALERAWNEAKLPSEREHVTPHIVRNPTKFRTKLLRSNIPGDYSKVRLSIDYKEDLIRTEMIMKGLAWKKIFHLKDILEFIAKNPEVLTLGQNVDRFEGYKKSLAKDKKCK